MPVDLENGDWRGIDGPGPPGGTHRDGLFFALLMLAAAAIDAVNAAIDSGLMSRVGSSPGPVLPPGVPPGPDTLPLTLTTPALTFMPLTAAVAMPLPRVAAPGILPSARPAADRVASVSCTPGGRDANTSHTRLAAPPMRPSASPSDDIVDLMSSVWVATQRAASPIDRPKSRNTLSAPSDPSTFSNAGRVWLNPLNASLAAPISGRPSVDFRFSTFDWSTRTWLA